ncbi:O-antigen ligase family protein [Planococcus shixiaomingii]|uniref:O-antigen ligase family protein n=1 Tax=Planococcus shixiaomingii TaxID=3058393 RepID=UPI00261D6685|nr:hypothetical protein [Planococcus sp. N022]WKA53992.1 hypothetical protein QWY21_15170 [Planococcus sp. N022]
MNSIFSMKIRTAKEDVWLIILSAYAMNLLAFGVYLPLILIIPSAFYLLKGKFTRLFFLNVFVLLSFSLVYVLILHLNSNVTLGFKIMYLFYPTTLFLLGHMLIGNDVDYKKVFKMIFVMIISFAFFAALSFLNTFLIYGNYDNSMIALKGRYVVSIWDNSLVTATGLNTYLSLSLSLLGLVFLNSNKIEKASLIKISSVCLFIMCIYISFVAGNRTSIVLAIVSFIIVILFSDKLNTKKIRSIITVVFLLAFSKIAFAANWFDLQTKLQSSNLYLRFKEVSLMEDPRIEVWKNSLKEILKNPIDTREISLDLNFAHNMWLDVGIVGGVMPLILLSVFTIISLFIMITFLKSNHPVMLKGMILGLFTAFYLQFFVEPIFQGWFTFFNVFCFIVGILLRVNHNNKNKVKPILEQIPD